MILIDDDRRRNRDFAVFAAFFLGFLLTAFLIGVWSERSDAKARELLMRECGPEQLAVVTADGHTALCIEGSRRAKR